MYVPLTLRVSLEKEHGRNMELHFFDRKSEYSVIERRLPHWTQPGVVCFITFRTHDSMPKQVVQSWRDERNMWLRKHDIDPDSPNWSKQLRALGKGNQKEFYRTFSTRWHDHLDTCHGACVLKQPELATIVGDSLKFADGDRYDLTDFVVMPNHVHLLASFFDEEGMLKQCESWKHWTARQINLALGQKGRFWQQDGFDHLVRSEEQFLHFRRYIQRNPIKAGLVDGEFLHYSK